jgi:2-polyprenyl-6-methoxyphenol hydroxylase-like FAD-dependent oxidoreductase
LERLFPGFATTAVVRGAVPANAATEVSWGLGGHRLATAPDTLPVIVSTRPFLEHEIRRRVAAIANVGFLTEARVSDFALNGEAVIGVVVERGSGPAERIEADLVVDATGRGSRLPAWLREHGFAPPAEEIMEVDVGYATARYRADPERLGRWRAMIVGATPACPRSGVVHVVEGGMIEVSLTGYRSEHPSATRASFVAHAASLALPDIHRLIHDAEPCSDIALFRVARTVRRHYQKLARIPAGIVAMGDAICAFNPVFAQGMTVAALEALELREVLRQAEPGLPPADLVPRFYPGGGPGARPGMAGGERQRLADPASGASCLAAGPPDVRVDRARACHRGARSAGGEAFHPRRQPDRCTDGPARPRHGAARAASSWQRNNARCLSSGRQGRQARRRRLKNEGAARKAAPHPARKPQTKVLVLSLRARRARAGAELV